MLKTCGLPLFLETLKSFDFYCNKEHELISLNSMFRGSDEVEVT